mgnify:CR=1 FL=1
MKASGVPIIPGSGILENVDEAKKAAKEIGYPVMLKASAGGGGKGIRLVKTEDELEQAFKTASSEAQQAFGDGRMYMEKYIYPAKHIEVQLLCDEQGHVVCLGERECSIQRNNQKLIEESPSPGVTKEKRAELFEAATKAAKRTQCGLQSSRCAARNAISSISSLKERCFRRSSTRGAASIPARSARI